MVKAGSLEEYSVNSIIGLINEMELDGETMQYILEQTAMDEQMHRQLVMSKHVEDTLALLEEKDGLIRL